MIGVEVHATNCRMAKIIIMLNEPYTCGIRCQCRHVDAGGEAKTPGSVATAPQ